MADDNRGQLRVRIDGKESEFALFVLLRVDRNEFVGQAHLFQKERHLLGNLAPGCSKILSSLSPGFSR